MNPEKPIEAMKKPGDEDAVHLGAFVNDKLIGIVSFYEEEQTIWRIRGMAVNPSYQKKGIGRRLIETGYELLENVMTIWCNSRISAIPFYERLGFTAVSEEFYLPGHGKRIRMEIMRRGELSKKTL